MNGNSKASKTSVIVLLLSTLITLSLLMLTTRRGTAEQELDHKIIVQKDLLNEDDVIAVFPPIAGG